MRQKSDNSRLQFRGVSRPFRSFEGCLPGRKPCFCAFVCAAVVVGWMFVEGRLAFPSLGGLRQVFLHYMQWKILLFLGRASLLVW